MNVHPPTVSELVDRQRIELSRPAHQMLRAALLPAGWHPAEYVAELIERGMLRDARHFLAHALPRRRALWWACLCARDVREFVAEDELQHVLSVAVAFVQEPAESIRREAERAMQAVELNSFTAQLAAAVVMSHGSLAPADGTPVSVPPFVLGRLVSTVVYMASAKKNVVRYLHHMREYLELGRQIAQGQHLWPQSLAGPAYRLDGEHPAVSDAHFHAPRSIGEDAGPPNFQILSSHSPR